MLKPWLEPYVAITFEQIMTFLFIFVTFSLIKPKRHKLVQCDQLARLFV